MKSSCNLGTNLGKDLGRFSKFALLLNLMEMWVQVKNVRYPYDATSYMNTRWGHLTHRFVVKICGWARGIAQAYISDICWWPLISVWHARAYLIRNTVIDVSAWSILPGYHITSPQTQCGQWGTSMDDYIVHFIFYIIPRDKKKLQRLRESIFS